MKKLIMLLIMGTMFLTNCKENSTDPSGDSVLWPFAVGNYWYFANYSYITSDPDTKEYFDTLKLIVEEEIVVENETWYKMNLGDNLFKNDENGVWLLDPDEDDQYLLENKTMILKYPSQVGDKWQEINDGSKYETIGLNEQVNVEAGTFSCLHFVAMNPYDDDYRTHLYFSPNVGYIKNKMIYEIIDENDVQDTVYNISQLVKYYVK